MQSAVFSRKLTGILAAMAICTSSTGAIAASSHQKIQQAGISPLVALSALGSDASRAALCGASAAAAAGAAVIQGAAPGCVLPVMDAAPVAIDTMPPPPVPPPPVAPAGGGFAISPLLLALAGIAAAALAYYLLKKDKDEDESPD